MYATVDALIILGKHLSRTRTRVFFFKNLFSLKNKKDHCTLLFLFFMQKVGLVREKKWV
jgi:hypothetical protein